MLAAVFTEDGTLSVGDVERPKPGPRDVRVKLKVASLCGSDLNYLDGKVRPGSTPVILGHEGAGTVQAVGDSVTEFAAGDRVLVHYVQSCGACGRCYRGQENLCRNRQSVGHHLHGTFAEYICVRPQSLAKVPPDIPWDQLSVSGCAVPTALHAVRHSGMVQGDTVVVFGIGGVGMHVVLWARRLGAAKIFAVDLAESQFPLAQHYGAHHCLNPESDDVVGIVREATGGWGADAAFECSGASQAMRQAVACVNGANVYESGAVIGIGVQSEPLSLTYSELRGGRVSVSVSHTREDLRQILRLLASGSLDLSLSVTHRTPLAEIEQGFQWLRERKEPVGRVVVEIG